jgi:hypothetical protein
MTVKPKTITCTVCASAPIGCTSKASHGLRPIQSIRRSHCASRCPRAGNPWRIGDCRRVRPLTGPRGAPGREGDEDSPCRGQATGGRPSKRPGPSSRGGWASNFSTCRRRDCLIARTRPCEGLIRSLTFASLGKMCALAARSTIPGGYCCLGQSEDEQAIINEGVDEPI